MGRAGAAILEGTILAVSDMLRNREVCPGPGVDQYASIPESDEKGHVAAGLRRLVER